MSEKFKTSIFALLCAVLCGLVATTADAGPFRGKKVTVLAPVANFSANVTTGVSPLAVTFTDLSTNKPTAWAWNFGDGGTSTAKNPVYTYNAPGIYTVSLTATNSGGSNKATKTNYIEVTKPPLAADFSATPTSGAPPLTVQFTDKSGGSPTAWAWDFGDGQTSTEQNPSHIYDTIGSFTVSLTVSDDSGSDETVKTNYIRVDNPPAASFTLDPLYGLAPLPVTFTNTSEGTIDSMSWDFGDKTTSTETNPVHTYNTPGFYAVVLTVVGPGGTATSELNVFAMANSYNVCSNLCDFTKIQDAINGAIAYSLILVKPETYRENINFGGKALLLVAQKGPSQTIIDGGQLGPVVSFQTAEPLGTSIIGFTLQNGLATNGGGIVVSNSASPFIIQNRIKGNTATNQGGGIYVNKAMPFLSGNVISGNSAVYGGGMALASAAAPMMVNSIISGNKATSTGGGLYLSTATTFSAFANNTLAGNMAAKDGGAVMVAAGAIFDAVNSIFANNAISGGPDEISKADPNTSIVDVNYSLVTGGWAVGTGNIDGDPLFVNPQVPDLAPTSEGDYHIMRDSPCIDTGLGDSTGYLFLPLFDIDLQHRPKGLEYDMGADEYYLGRSAEATRPWKATMRQAIMAEGAAR